MITEYQRMVGDSRVCNEWEIESFNRLYTEFGDEILEAARYGLTVNQLVNVVGGRDIARSRIALDRLGMFTDFPGSICELEYVLKYHSDEVQARPDYRDWIWFCEQADLVAVLYDTGIDKEFLLENHDKGVLNVYVYQCLLRGEDIRGEMYSIFKGTQNELTPKYMIAMAFKIRDIMGSVTDVERVIQPTFNFAESYSNYLNITYNTKLMCRDPAELVILEALLMRGYDHDKVFEIASAIWGEQQIFPELVLEELVCAILNTDNLEDYLDLGRGDIVNVLTDISTGVLPDNFLGSVYLDVPREFNY